MSYFVISIFCLLLAGGVRAQSPGIYTDLHDFGGTVTEANGTTGPDGTHPGDIAFDSAGNMYGVTADDGAYDEGTVWEITTSGTYKDLHDFGGTVANANGKSGRDGYEPIGVTLDSAGNIYGTTIVGGPNQAGPYVSEAGMVWEITANGTYKDLHDFGGTIINANGTSGPDGFHSAAGVTFDTAGNMYGTTSGGGPTIYYGMLWEITASGAYKDLHDFGETVIDTLGVSGQDGFYPEASVTFDTAGNLYGTASQGGAAGVGIVWEITSAGTYEDLHDFGFIVINANGSIGTDGFYPEASVTFDSAGNMYGTTYKGGANGSNDGIVWELAPSGLYKYLHDFGGTIINSNGTSGADGEEPEAAITFDSAGNIFGTTSQGGANGGGVVWEMTASGTYRDLHDFGATATNAEGTAGWDGFAPNAAVIFDKAGNLIGTAGEGGPYYDGGGPYNNNSTPSDLGGIVWKLAPSASAPSDLTATVGTGGVAPITLSWNAVSGAIIYRVYRSTVSNGEANPALVGGLGTPGYTDPSARTVGATYYYKVTAVNTNGPSPFSNEAAVTLTAAAPAGLTATAAAGGVNPVTLAWIASRGAGAYNVYLGTSLIGSTTATSFYAYGMAGVVNSYTVTAGNISGTSPASNTATVTLSPATPATLTATAGSNRVILNWSASTGAIVYRVYRSTTSRGEANPALAGGLGTTGYTDTAAVNGVTYYYEVTAVNTAGASRFSTQVSATPGSGAPLAPILETVAPAAGGVAPITLTWTSSAGATVYRVYRSTVSGGETNPALIGGLTTTAYTDAGNFTPGITYYYEVTAVNTGGASAFSNQLGVLLTPAAAMGLTATAATGGVAPVAVAWTASVGATGYNVYRGTTQIGSTGATPAFSDATVIPAGIGVSYTVTAVNAGGTSAASAAVAVLLRPAAPLNLIATASRSQVVLNWTASAGAVVYRVYRSTTSGGEANPALAGGIGSPGYTDTTVVSGAFYYYTVSAVNTAGASGFSNECDAPTGPVTAPPLLTATTAAGGLAPITLAWAAVPGATFYRVYRSTTSGGEGNPALAVGVTNTDFTDTAVSAGLTYYYKVTAVDAIGASGFTNEASATMTPATPTGLLATPVAGPVVDLVWNESAGATSYNVYRGTASGLETLLTTVSGPAYADSGVTPSMMYYYEVTAVNTGGQSGRSNEGQATTN